MICFCLKNYITELLTLSKTFYMSACIVVYKNVVKNLFIFLLVCTYLFKIFTKIIMNHKSVNFSLF